MKRTAITLIAGGVVVSVLFALSVILGAPQPPPSTGKYQRAIP